MTRHSSIGLVALSLFLGLASAAPLAAQSSAASKATAAKDSSPPKIDTRRGDAMLAEYFAGETKRIEEADVVEATKTREEWLARQGELRRQLHEMLGLDPLPERTPLNAAITGKLDHEAFTVEKLHFQSSPGLYVTGNLYIPKGLTKPAPAVLYVCGHGNTVKNGVSYGSKSVYQHHGAWLARHGIICLTIDTLQLGEVQGLHHGTHHKGMFWWYSRGYTPAGVEAWNGIRALDYLQSRPEVDGAKLGVTGRSGGGAYSWWLAALDERIKAAVPVAGITDLQNYVVDGKVEGHCDCMFMVNTYQWDYGTVASLVAPRALLLTNTDDDPIFPLDGVERVHWQTKKIYSLLGVPKNLGLQVSWGGHYDTQELQVAAFRWFLRHLKGEDPKISIAATKLFEPEQLKVFDELPRDQRNTSVQEWFVPVAAKPTVPSDASEWATMRDGWMKSLREKTFRAWPEEDKPPKISERRIHASTLTVANVDFSSEPQIELTLAAMGLTDGKPAANIRLTIPASENDVWTSYPAGEVISIDPTARLFVRGIADTQWDPTPKKQAQIRRRFYLLGQTLEGQQVYDVRRAIQALHEVPEFKDAKITLQAKGPMAAIALYAALFEPSVDRLELTDLPKSHMPERVKLPPTFTDAYLRESTVEYGPFAAPLLNVLKTMDVPQAVALAAEHATVELTTADAEAWKYPLDVAKQLGWKDRVVVKSK
jgi:cephalosporin-C deacetylase-like acetyl esterase